MDLSFDLGAQKKPLLHARAHLKAGCLTACMSSVELWISCTDLAEGPDEVHDGVAVEVARSGKDPVDGHKDALAGRLRHRLTEVLLLLQFERVDEAQGGHLSQKSHTFQFGVCISNLEREKAR